jgi:GDP-L-fucose synthase
MVEENYLLGEPVAELYAYGMTKRMLLIGLRALSSQYGSRYLYLVPSTLMGPHYKAIGKQLHFIFDIIRKIIRGSIYGEPVVLWGDGYQKRELIFVGDFVDAALRLAATVDNEIVNIGSGREYSIRWYASEISRRLDFNPGNIQYDVDKYTGVRSKQLSIEKLSSLLKDFQPTPIETALDQTLRWCKEEAKSSMETA